MANTYVGLASNVLTSANSTITFSGISSAYTDLVIRFSVRGDASGSLGANASMIFNSDSSSTYYYQWLKATSGAGATAANVQATSSILLGTILTAGNASNCFSSGEIYFQSYSKASTNRTCYYELGSCETNPANSLILSGAGNWSSNTAISSITISVNNGNFIAGSRFDLYGIVNQ